MTKAKKVDKPAAKKDAATPCDEAEEPCPLAELKYEVTKIEVQVTTQSNKVIMNDPEAKCLVTALVTYKRSNAEGALDSLPDKVVFTFTDPDGNNTDKPSSFNYTGSKHLGKKADASATYWVAQSGYSAASDDSFNSNAKVTCKDVTPNEAMQAQINFKPSGVGGNEYKITAKVFKADGVSELVSAQSTKFVIWRKVSFDKIYEMKSMTHVSTNAATATIAPVYNPAFVEYTAGTRTELTTAQSVKYIGLWKDTATPQRSWATVQAKIPAETPSATEITDAKYTGSTPEGLLKRTAARAAILAKAQAWADRIDSAFSRDMNKWIADVSLPANAVVGIQYYHPKFSSRGGDFATSEWKLGEPSVPAWLRVGAFQKSSGGHYYTNLDPDGLWVNWGGLSHGSGRVSVPTGISSATTKQVIRHEAGHATKSWFKREPFGPSLDHSASNAGIMYYTTSGGTTFTTREKKILRGITP